MFLMSGAKRTFSSYHQNVVCSRHEIAENCSFGIEQQSRTHYIFISSRELLPSLGIRRL